MTDLARYFDFNATTPMSEVARKAWLEASDLHWQNPSSLYREAGFAKQRLEDCREDLADLLGIEEPERIVFTSGATEANNAILQYIARKSEGSVAISAVEHPCVDAPALFYLGEERIREIPVDPNTGVVDLDVLSRWIRDRSVEVVSVMAANNETGTLQPWEEIAKLCQENEIWFHSDAAQWIGKLPGDQLGQCDFLTGSGHKFGGGKGAGFFVLPEDEKAEDFSGLIGGPQEEGRRAGTENLPAILAMVAALEEKSDLDLKILAESKAGQRDEFEKDLAARIDVKFLGASGPRLWNTSMLVLPWEKNLKWLTRLSRTGFSVSTGSACSAGKGNPSRVMAAMGLEWEEMGRVLRLSGGWDTSAEDWSNLAEAMQLVGQELGKEDQ